MHDCDEPDGDNWDLTIRPVRKDKTEWPIKREYSDRLPDLKHSATVALVSSIYSGKTTLLCNLLASPLFYGGGSSQPHCLDTVYIFSPSLSGDESMKRLQELDNFVCYDLYDERILQRIIDAQMEKDSCDRECIAIVCDDCTGHLSRNSRFYTIATSARHWSSLLCYVVQNYKALPNYVRNNVTDYLIGTNNGAQIEAVGDEICDKVGGMQNWLSLHGRCVPARYNFAYVRLAKNPVLVHHNFDKEPLFRGED